MEISNYLFFEPMEYLWLFILLALLAEVLGTIGGFGSSLFFVPIAAYFLDFHSVLGITALFHVTSNLSKIILFKKGFDKNIVLYLGIPAVIFVVIGAYLSQFVQTKILEILLSVFLIGISLFFLFAKKVNIQPTNKSSIIGGTLSGFTAGLFGTGGAVRGTILAAFHLKKEVFIATSAIIDLAIDCSRSAVYIYNGYVHKHDIYLIPILFIVSIIGTLIGKKVLTHISDKSFRNIVLVLILFTGITTLFKWFMST
ncbi:MAG: sulfite exporter TauE/SafE family protein [Chitinophagales bacterium]|nr:sulfite exporter TauE/SafE family protein [Chitinophagales bacterium]